MTRPTDDLTDDELQLRAWAVGIAADAAGMFAGAAVLPVSRGTKRAATAHGVLDATRDPDQVRTWWTGPYRGASIGVRPGPGVLVLDLDERNDGPANLRAYRTARGLELPDTLTTRTPGGWHVWLEVPAGQQWRGKLAEVGGCDVKTSSGYLLAPPSPHPAGGRYRWHRYVDIAPAPQWVLDIARPADPEAVVRDPAAVEAAASDRVLSGLVAKVAEAQEGNRNNATYWAACRLVEHVAAGRLQLELGAAAIIDAAVSTGLPRAAAERTVRSATRQARGSAA